MGVYQDQAYDPADHICEGSFLGEAVLLSVCKGKNNHRLTQYLYELTIQVFDEIMFARWIPQTSLVVSYIDSFSLLPGVFGALNHQCFGDALKPTIIWIYHCKKS